MIIQITYEFKTANGFPTQNYMLAYTPAEAEDICRKAERLGFETEAPDGKWFRFTRIKSDFVNFWITEDIEGSNWKERIARTTFVAHASISTMGGNPTVEELTKASDEIRCAAILMKKVNDWHYTTEERF